jgi:hypothetical protein
MLGNITIFVEKLSCKTVLHTGISNQGQLPKTALFRV